MGNKFRIARDRLKLTQEQVAERAGRSAKQLSAIESGRKFTTPETILELSKAMDITPGQLLDEIDPDAHRPKYTYFIIQAEDTPELHTLIDECIKKIEKLQGT